MRITSSLTVIAVAVALLALDVEPVSTWFYVLVWYPTLVIADAVATHRTKKPSLFASPARLFSLLGWSAAIWLIYEAANLRVANWYYVFLPASQLWRWAGILLSFATVVPAIVLAERVLEGMGVGTKWKSKPITCRPLDLVGSVVLGVSMAAAALAWPRLFSPLLWGAGVLIADPFVYRARSGDSLIGDIATGQWHRVGRLMLGGLAIGLLWETLNFWARGKWIYTVPHLEHIKLLEMPPLGFVGFPVFALSAWSLYNVLCTLGVAVPPSGTPRIDRRRLPFALVLGIAFSIAVLSAMERRTISSTAPLLLHTPGVSEELLPRLEAAGVHTPFDLSRIDTDSVAQDLGLPTSALVSLRESARLVTLRGIGTDHAALLGRLNVSNVCDLARANPSELWDRIHGLQDYRNARPTQAEVRVWHHAAERVCENK